MILKKINVNGETTYKEITLEEALSEAKEDLIFTDSKDEEAYIKATSSEETHDEEKVVDLENILNKVNEKVGSIGKIISDKINDKVKVFHFEGTKRSNLTSILPFMEEEDVFDIAKKIIEKKEQKISLVEVLPFLNERHCDELFLQAIEQEEFINQATSFAPFVSEDCLSKVVDGYLEGKYQNLNLSTLYPFMKNEDVKRIFHYLYTQESNKE